MTKWEYYWRDISDEITEDEICDIGLEGWELVAVDRDGFAWFKRPISDNAESDYFTAYARKLEKGFPQNLDTPEQCRTEEERFLSEIRTQNKVFFGLVLAQAEVFRAADALIITFTSDHKALSEQCARKKLWLERIAGCPVQIEVE